MLSHLVLTHLQCTKSLVNSAQVQAVLKLLISRALQRKILFLRHRTLLFADMGWIKTVPMERNLQLQCLLPFEQRLGVKVQRCVIFRSFHGRHKATNLDACGIRITSYSPPKNTIQNLSFAALLVLQCEDLEINRTHSAEYRTSHSMKWSLTARMFHSNSHSVFANPCRFEKESCLCLQTQTRRVCFQTELHLLTCGPQNDSIMCDYPPTVTYNNVLHLGMFCFTGCLKVMVWCAFSAFAEGDLWLLG